jgi:putative ABC transport system permease protein
MKNLFQFIGLRHLKRRPGRTAFSIAGISCGIALYVAISIINDSTSGYFRDSMAAVSGKATLTVNAGELGFAEAIGEQVEAIPGVKGAVPVVENRGWLSTPDGKGGESLMVMGVDLLQEKAVRSYKSEGKAIIGDSLTFITHPDSMILTDGFAKVHGYKIGSPVELLTAKGKQTFTVRAILSPTGLATAYGGALAIMDIDAARLAFGKEGKTDRLDVVTAAGADVAAVAASIRKSLPVHFEVARPEMQSEQMERMVSSFQFMSRFFSSLALIVGIFLIANSISMSIAERRKEIGTLRALGTKRSGILTLFLAESVAMGAMGALIGAFLGRGLAGYLVKAVTNAMTEQFKQEMGATALKFDAATVLGAVAIGAVSSLFAALWPSIKATRVEPIEAMKRKDTGEQSLKGLGRYMGWIGAGLLGVSGALSAAFSGPGNGAIQASTQILAVIGAALLGPALVLALMRALQPIAVAISENGGGMIPRLAVENILRNPRRTGTNVMSLMVGLILVVIIACVNVSFKGTLLGFFGRVLHADLIISTTGRLQSHENQPLDPSVKPLIDSNPAVLGSYELREIKLSYGESGDKLLLKYYGEPPVPQAAAGQAAEPRYAIFDVTDRDGEKAGHELFHSTEPTAIISENFSLHTGKKTGDMLELTTPRGRKAFKIVGVATEYASPFGTVYLSRDTYQKYFDDRLVSGYAVKLKAGFDPAQVRQELDRELSRKFKLTILLNSDIRGQVSRVIDNSFAYTRAIEWAALLVALLGLMNTLIITVMERTREIGLSRSVGMTRRHVARMILLEAAGQGGLGALISVGIGVMLGSLWVTRSLAGALGWVVQFHVPWNGLVSTFALGLLVTLAAAWYPARRAAAIQIVDALDHD